MISDIASRRIPDAALISFAQHWADQAFARADALIGVNTDRQWEMVRAWMDAPTTFKDVPCHKHPEPKYFFNWYTEMTRGTQKPCNERCGRADKTLVTPVHVAEDIWGLTSCGIVGRWACWHCLALLSVLESRLLQYRHCVISPPLKKEVEASKHVYHDTGSHWKNYLEGADCKLCIAVAGNSHTNNNKGSHSRSQNAFGWHYEGGEHCSQCNNIKWGNKLASTKTFSAIVTSVELARERHKWDRITSHENPTPYTITTSSRSSFLLHRDVPSGVVAVLNRVVDSIVLLSVAVSTAALQDNENSTHNKQETSTAAERKSKAVAIRSINQELKKMEEQHAMG